MTRKRLEAYQRMQKKKGWGRRTAMWCFYPHHPISGGWWLDLGIDQAEKSSPPATRREHDVAHEGRRGSSLWCQRQCSGLSTHQISSKDHNLLDAMRRVMCSWNWIVSSVTLHIYLWHNHTWNIYLYWCRPRAYLKMPSKTQTKHYSI